VGAFQGFGDLTRRKPVGLASHQQSKNIKPRRLPEPCQSRQRMGRRQALALRGGTDVTDYGQGSFLH
jgi:hypothetical protein